ncbi:phosphoadenosine phosphosulfate reductase [Candidatus Erwinia haradaeae]|uniref:Phosphoadenosine 5'-phosphosulfate reductase n=1 Tax=Candidatus Erwinia haradaeae TaxID=1922217 RepID=A0A451DIJ3_9GAMM|nr:phosphoadenosine phosphosulfate reductase [Candidatus Erwinia haradaeae]VFP86484.1 Phosphoadenosine phosphosulfate reductase [Candidatus Erwinia haradaeae]
MEILNLIELCQLSKKERAIALENINHDLTKLPPEERVQWGLEHLPREAILTSSFGIQSVVSLHLITQQKTDISVVLTDTGYLFSETYQFIDQLTEQMQLKLHVFRCLQSPAWQESRYGKLWEQGIEGIEKYNQINKIEPLKRAIKELNAKTWFAGLRRTQASTRVNLPILTIQHGIFKLLPIIDWDDQKIFNYIKKHNLNYHPLWNLGYASVGDIHTTKKLETGMKEEDTRFFGLKRECGLHED